MAVLSNEGGLFGTNGYNALQPYADWGAKAFFVKNKKEFTRYLNEYDAKIEFNNAETVFTSRFKWEGKDIEIYPERYIERLLFYNGIAIAFYDEDLGFAILAATANGYNYFYEPASFNVIGNGFSKIINVEDCVQIRNTPNCWSPAVSMARQSSVIADTGRAVETYMQGMKKPNVIISNDKKAWTANVIANEMATNEPWIVVEAKQNKQGDPQFKEQPAVLVQQLQNNAQDLQGLILARSTLRNDMLSWQGIAANQAEKSQYKSMMEMEGDTTHIELLRRQAMDCRQKAIKEIREKFRVELTCTDMYAEIQEEQADRISDAKGAVSGNNNGVADNDSGTQSQEQ